MRGCEQPATIATLKLAGEPIERCPRRIIKEDPAAFSYVLQLYALYDKGILLAPGALQDQPYNYVEAMFVVGGAVAEIQDYYQSQSEKGKSPQDIKKKKSK